MTSRHHHDTLHKSQVPALSHLSLSRRRGRERNSTHTQLYYNMYMYMYVTCTWACTCRGLQAGERPRLGDGRRGGGAVAGRRGLAAQTLERCRVRPTWKRVWQLETRKRAVDLLKNLDLRKSTVLLARRARQQDEMLPESALGGGAATPGPSPARTRDGHACVRPRPARRRLHYIYLAPATTGLSASRPTSIKRAVKLS